MVRPHQYEPLKSGIIIPDALVKKSKLATVVKVGDKTTDIKEGSLIVFNPECGIEVEHNNEKVLLLNEDDFYGIYEQI